MIWLCCLFLLTRVIFVWYLLDCGWMLWLFAHVYSCFGFCVFTDCCSVGWCRLFWLLRLVWLCMFVVLLRLVLLFTCGCVLLLWCGWLALLLILFVCFLFELLKFCLNCLLCLCFVLVFWFIYLLRFVVML